MDDHRNLTGKWQVATTDVSIYWRELREYYTAKRGSDRRAERKRGVDESSTVSAPQTWIYRHSSSWASEASEPQSAPHILNLHKHTDNRCRGQADWTTALPPALCLLPHSSFITFIFLPRISCNDFVIT